ncbi:hypothetical protein T06_7933 [Trichinella sp. T6]|nr:hypothetical protein T06_7933 [Trichinella sp. T6]
MHAMEQKEKNFIAFMSLTKTETSLTYRIITICVLRACICLDFVNYKFYGHNRCRRMRCRWTPLHLKDAKTLKGCCDFEEWL